MSCAWSIVGWADYRPHWEKSNFWCGNSRSKGAAGGRSGSWIWAVGQPISRWPWRPGQTKGISPSGPGRRSEFVCLQSCPAPHPPVAPEVTILQGDVRHSFLKEGSYDLVLCSAFLHHFSDQEISELLKNWVSGSTAGVVISDLHRNLLAYLGIRFLTGLLSRSPCDPP